MESVNCTTPVALFFYQRTESTRRVIEQINAARPPSVYLIADQAPPDGDRDAVKSCREMVDEFDWSPDIDLHRRYADTHHGLHNRFVTGLAWLFSNESEAIILEDDCIPNTSFFEFCDVMLSEYRSNEQVWDIAGSNPLGEWHPEQQDYLFSRFGGIWGWATWRQSWEHYDPEMEGWDDPETREMIQEQFPTRAQQTYARSTYRRTANSLDTWDYPWGFSRHKHGGISIIPSRNLVSNVGVDERATNTSDESLVGLERFQHRPPYQGPRTVAVDEEFDRAYIRTRTRWWQRIPKVSRMIDIGRRIIQTLG